MCERLVDLVHLPARKGLAMLSSVDSDILLQTAPDSTSAAALGLPGPSILPPSAKLAAAGSAASTRINFITVIRSIAWMHAALFNTPREGVARSRRRAKAHDVRSFHPGQGCTGGTSSGQLTYETRVQSHEGNRADYAASLQRLMRRDETACQGWLFNP